jgi:hypothetical protein
MSKQAIRGWLACCGSLLLCSCTERGGVTGLAPTAGSDKLGSSTRAVDSGRRRFTNGFNNGFSNGFNNGLATNWRSGYYNGLENGFNNGFGNGFYNGHYIGYYDTLQNGLGNGQAASGYAGTGLLSQSTNLSWFRTPMAHYDGNVIRNDQGRLVVDFTFVQRILRMIAAYGTANYGWNYWWIWEVFVPRASSLPYPHMDAWVGHWDDSVAGHPVSGWATNSALGEPRGWMAISHPFIGAGPGTHVAYFNLLVHDNRSYYAPIVYVDVADYSTGEVLAARVIYTTDWNAAWTYQAFPVVFSLDDWHGSRHAIVLRAYSFEYGYVAMNWAQLGHMVDDARDPILSSGQPANFGHIDGSTLAGNYLKYVTECALGRGQSWFFDGVRYDGAVGLAPGALTGNFTVDQMKQIGGCLLAFENERGHRTFNLTSTDLPQLPAALQTIDLDYPVTEAAFGIDFRQFAMADSWPFGMAVFCHSVALNLEMNYEVAGGRVCATDQATCMAADLGICENQSGGWPAARAVCEGSATNRVWIIPNTAYSDYVVNYTGCHNTPAYDINGWPTYAQNAGNQLPWMITTSLPPWYHQQNPGGPCNQNADCQSGSCDLSALECL